MPGKPTPKHLAMLLCDYLILDAETRNKSLIGIFHRIQALKFPVRHDRMHVFVALTDGHGEYTGRHGFTCSRCKGIVQVGPP